MQTDQYSSHPGCVESENLDIFSSSQSVQATARSEPVFVNPKVVDIDERGRFELHTNGRVFDTKEKKYITDNSNFSEMANKISDSGDPWAYEMATFGEPKKLFVKYEWEERKLIVVITDRLMYSYFPEGNIAKIDIIKTVNCTKTQRGELTKPEGKSKTFKWVFSIDMNGLSKAKIEIRKRKNTVGDVRIKSIYQYRPRYLYKPESDRLWFSLVDSEEITVTDNIDGGTEKAVVYELLAYQDGTQYKNGCFQIEFEVINTTEEEQGKFDGYLYFRIEERIKSSFAYLTKYDKRLIKKEGERLFMTHRNYCSYWELVPEWNYKNGIAFQNYKLLENTAFDLNATFEVVDFLVVGEMVYLFANQDGVWFIFYFSLAEGGDPEKSVRFPWMIIKKVIAINQLIYLVAERRWIAGLYGFNGVELVEMIGGTEKNGEKNLISTREQFRFNGLICEWRENIILGTSDNSIFLRGKTNWGKAGAFILRLSEKVKLLGIEATKEGLQVIYEQDKKKWRKTLLSDRAIKTYEAYYKVVYPIYVGTHEIEKEESDLYLSYILPSKECRLEVRGMANHYHFWTFEVKEEVNIEEWDEYTLAGCQGNYHLEFIEKNGKKLTFVLRGDLPVQVSNEQKLLRAYGNWPENVEYSRFHHFRKLAEITAEKYTEGTERFTGLANKLDLPETHSLQIMIEGYGTKHHTPQLFGVHLLTDQRQEW